MYVFDAWVSLCVYVLVRMCVQCNLFFKGKLMWIEVAYLTLINVWNAIVRPFLTGELNCQVIHYSSGRMEDRQKAWQIAKSFFCFWQNHTLFFNSFLLCVFLLVLFLLSFLFSSYVSFVACLPSAFFYHSFNTSTFFFLSFIQFDSSNCL